MAGGRPLKFQTVEELEAKIADYFRERNTIEFYPNGDMKPKPITITGLALALDTTRQTLINYEVLPEFLDTISRAKLRCENYAEERLYIGAATGPIFALKNFDWKDSQDVNQHNTGEPQIVITKNYINKE